MGLRRGAGVQSFVREGPCLLGIFARWRAGREYLVWCNWRSERNRNPTLSGLWIIVQAPRHKPNWRGGHIASQRRHLPSLARVIDLLNQRIRRIGALDEFGGSDHC